MKKYNFLGLSVTSYKKDQLKDFIVKTVHDNKSKILYGYSLSSFRFASESKVYLECSENADIFVTDGRFFYLLAKLYGIKLYDDLSIPNLVLNTLLLANEKKWKVYLLGATDENNKLAIKNIKNMYKNIELIDGFHGYFDPNIDISSILNRLLDFSPNVVLIGMSSPLKEIIANKIRDNKCANIIIPCGGMIDVLSGKIRLTPKWIKKIGFASLFRLIQEPKKLFKRRIKNYLYIFFVFLPYYFFSLVKKCILSKEITS